MDEIWERTTQYVGSFVIISTVIGIIGFLFYRLTVKPVINDLKMSKK